MIAKQALKRWARRGVGAAALTLARVPVVSRACAAVMHRGAWLLSATGRMLQEPLAMQAMPAPHDDGFGSLRRRLADVDWAALSSSEIAERMEQRFASGEAYASTILWDEVRARELAAAVVGQIATQAGGVESLSIVDLGAGVGGIYPTVAQCAEYVGVELSPSAVEQARRSFGASANATFVVGDVTKLELADERFDVAVAREVIEHVPDPAALLAEARRVLKRGGLLVLTTPNRDSLHLRMNRRLGHADFKCSFDHTRELTFTEARGYIEAAGFEVVDTAGVFLMPYWGIPGVDGPVRSFTDNDPEVVETLRDLGRRAGAEYAFCSVFAARKV